jgi:prefoldin subunit 5
MQVEGVYIWRPVALLGVTSQWGGTIGEIPTLYYDVDNDPQYLIMIEDTAGVLVDNFELLGNNLPAASFSGVTASGRAMESGAADDAPADPAVSTCDGVIVRTNNKPVYDISLVNLDIAYCDGVGIKFIGYGLPFSDILIDGCEFYALSYQGIYMQVTFEDLMYDEELLINYDIIITGCEFVNTLMAMPDDTYGATIELWGIMDTLITDNYFLGSGAGGSTYSEYLWYMALIVTGESVLVTQNVLDTWIGGDAQNGVYVETDAAEEHVHGRFTAYTPVFHYNQFWLYITEDAYAIDYYEGGLATGEDWEADVIDATKNFWWDNVIYSGRGDLGPYSDPNHDYNPNEDGTGCQVQDYINFAPWYMDRYLRYLTCDVFISLDKNVQRAYVEGDPIYYMIQWAVDDAEAGDWVIVNPGQYYEDVLVGKSIFLLGGYTQRGGFLMPMMWGAGELVAIVQVFTPGILAPAGSSSLGASLSAAAPGVAVEETSATVDFFNFVGDSWILVDVYTATAVVSNNAFIGSDGWYYGQIGVCVEQYSTASVFGNYFDHVSQDTWQEYGAVGVWSGSSAEIYDNIFEGNYEETAVWAWDVVEPLNIMENSIEGFYYGVNIDKYLGDDVGSTGVYIGGNFIDDCLIGVNLNTVEETLVEENTIIGAETEVPVAPGIDDWEYEYSFDVLVYAAGENVVVTHNNLLTWGNQDDTVGIWNAWSLGDGWSDVAADDNYWGKPSGPSGAFWAWDDWEVDSPYDWNYAMWDAWGAGTIVTFNVTYTTWFGMPISIGFSVTAVFDAPIYVDDFTALDPYYSEDTNIEIVSASGDGYVVLGKYLDPEDVETSMNPVTGFWGYNVKLYFEISVWHESEDLDSLTVRLYFDDGDLDGININELRLFFWSQDAFGWIPCVFSAVNADEMYVEITFSEESLPSMDMLRNDMPFLIGAPKVVITPAEGKSGITVTGWAAGFMPGQAVTVYLGSSLMGALPTQVKGIYIVDMNGNITEIEFILPYLNKGVYQITVTDPAWFMEYEVEYYATTTYTVLGNSPLLLSLDVGAMYFAGEIVNWVFSVTEEGTPYDVTPDMITAYLVYAPSLEEVQVPAENILQVDADTFVVTMALPGDAMVGEYYLEVFVADEMYQGAAGKAFLVSQTFGDIIPMLVSIEDGIMNLQAGCDALQVSVDAVKAVVDRIDGNVVSIKTTLGVVKTTVDQINVKVTDIQGTLVTMQAQINGGFSQVQSKLEDISAQIASVDDGIVTLQTSVGVVQTTLNAIGAKVVTIENGVAELQTSMGEVQLALVAIAATVDDIDGNVVTLQTAVGTVQTTLNQLGASIVAIDGKIVSLQTAVGTVQTTLNAIGVTVEKIEGRTVYMNSTLGQITGTLASMTGTLATINTNVGTIKTDVSNISSNTTGINSLVSFIILLVLLIVAIVLIFLRTQKK